MNGSLARVPIPGGPRPSRTPPHPLPEVAARLGVTSPAAADVVVSGVSLSSRTVRPGDLYAALPGLRFHGAQFVPQALEAGAVAVLTDPAGAEVLRASGHPATVPVLVVAAPRAVLGDLACWLYGEPSRDLLTLGVTGTNGKTTTTFLLDAALRATGIRTGLVGTVEIRVAAERVVSTGTTPEAPDLHALLAVMREHDVTACSMEISSHALAQHRVDGLVVDVAGFTNLSQDHLDYHRTMEDYFEAKALLFTPGRSRRGVVCVDDAWGRRLAASAQVPVVTMSARPAGSAGGPSGAPADWQVLSVRLVDGLPVAQVATPGGRELTVTSPLPGDFNVANTVLALAMLVEAGQDVDLAVDALAGAGSVPGRMERVGVPDETGAPLAVVDYAHTPDAVAAALAALRGSGHPLVVVLGAGGDRDTDKRPLMGAAAARGADVVVVTDDNPRSEDPAAIRAAVLAGAREAARREAGRALPQDPADAAPQVLEVADRGHAIAEAVARAWGGGVVLVAGKGHEQGQEVAGNVHPFDDRVVLRTALTAAAASLPEESRR